MPDVIVRKSRKASGARASTPTRCRGCASTGCTPTSCRRARAAARSSSSSQLQEARWLIKNVQQRFDTILRVSQAIVDRQRHFFEHGEVAMRPLVLREIAEALGLHEIAPSRA